MDKIKEIDKVKALKIAGGILFLVITLVVYFSGGTGKDNEILLVSEAEGTRLDSVAEAEGAGIPEEMIIVDVAGAVNNPKVAELPLGSRVYQAIEAAGGKRHDADTSDINLAASLNDEERVYIPTVAEKESMEIEKKNSGIVNINSASVTELQEIPGVGPSTAVSIMDYRIENGEFETIEDIKNIDGIGEKTFEKIKEKISVK